MVADPPSARAIEYLNYFDEHVYNHVPQYLLRVHDMKIVSRETLRSDFQPRALERARAMIMAEETSTEAFKVTRLYTWIQVVDSDVLTYLQKDIKRLLTFAIFSHRWGNNEPTFKDMSTTQRSNRKGPGFEKLRRFCEVAKADYRCEYVWSDTCCINKESSAELEEAIRSMFRWYEDAYICIVYLAHSSSIPDFPSEPWFRRGWTLQELLASRRIRIYGKDWSPLCPRKEEGRDENFPHPNDKRSDFVLQAISAVTNIRVDSIRTFNPTDVSVAERMRWASTRRTTRVEDVAYSLLGIFDVSMPIAYGEGDRAFQRLLQAIAQRSQDPSLLAWSGPPSRHSHALSPSPAFYKTLTVGSSGGDSTFTIQKRGIHIKLLLIHVQVTRRGDNCTLEPSDANLVSSMTLNGGFPSRLQTSLESHYALGVVNYDLHPSRDDIGQLNTTGGRRYFGLILEFSQKSVLGFWLCKRKEETNGLLTIVGNANDYETELTTVCLLH